MLEPLSQTCTAPLPSPQREPPSPTSQGESPGRDPARREGWAEDKEPSAMRSQPRSRQERRNGYCARQIFSFFFLNLLFKVEVQLI